MAENNYTILSIINADNVVGFINNGGTANSAVKVAYKELVESGKTMSQMVVEENYNQETYNEILKNKETLGLISDSAASFVSNVYNQGTLSGLTIKFDNDSSEAFYNELKEDQSVISEYKKEIGNIIKSEESSNSNNTFNAAFRNDNKLETEIESFFNSENGNENWKNVLDTFNGDTKAFGDAVGLTNEEMSRILGTGDYATKNGVSHDMFNYAVGNNSCLHELSVDDSILQKFSQKEIFNSKGEDILAAFKIRDLDGNVLKAENFNTQTMAILKSIDSSSGGKLKAINGKSWQFLKARVQIAEVKKQIIKYKGGGNLLKLGARATGMNTMTKQFNQFTGQTKQGLNVIKAASKGTETAAKLGYKGFKFLSIFSDKNKLKGDLTEEYRRKIEQKLAKKVSGFDSFERKVSTIRHPLSALKNKIVNSRLIQDSLIVKAKHRLGGGLASINKALFGGIGKTFKPLLDIVFKIIKTLCFGILFPILFILIIVMILGFLAEGQKQQEDLFVIMPVADEHDYQSYQTTYDTLDDNFLKSFEKDLGDFASTRNLKDEKIGFGVNGQNNESGMENTDYHNGIYYNFITDADHRGRSSNIEDCISMMAIMMTQNQNTYPDIANKIIEWLYYISHSYNYSESALYACDSACHNVFYKCTDIYNKYKNNDIKLNPFHAAKKSGGEYEILEPNITCQICSSKLNETIQNDSDGNPIIDCYIKQLKYNSEEELSEDYINENIKWCSVNSHPIYTCFHGSRKNVGTSEEPDYVEHSMGRNHSQCNNYEAIFECNNDNPNHECSNHEIGCHGYYLCLGHDHNACSGHNYKCCLGHVDLQANVEILFYEDMKDIVNEYNFGDNDNFYNLAVEENRKNKEDEKDEEGK